MSETTYASLGEPTVVVDSAEDQLLADTVLVERLNAVLAQVWAELAARASGSDFLALLAEVYRVDVSSEAAQILASRLAAGDTLSLRYEIESGAEMGSAAGAYAVVGDGGVAATIYINGDWLLGASDEQLRLVLLEEIGHSFDTELNGALDTAGDEGELFAALFSGAELTEEQRAVIAAENDSAILTIDGTEVGVEKAPPPDVTPPALSSGGLVTNTTGTTITLTFNEAIDQTVNGMPLFSRFTLAASGVVGSRTITVQSVAAVAGSTTKLALTLATPVYQGEVLTLSYTDPNPTTNDTTGVIQDSAGNDAASFVDRSVTNNSTIDGTPPALSSGGLVTNAAGTTITLTFNEAIDQTVNGMPLSSRFTLAASGVVGSRTITVQSVAAVAGSTTKLALTLATPVYQGEVLTLSYTDPNPTTSDTTGVIQDSAGNDAASFVDRSVTNNSTIDGTPPALSSGGLVTNAAGTTITLTFNEAIDQTLAGMPSGERFTLSATGGVLGSRTVAVQSVAAGSGGGGSGLTKLVLTLAEQVYLGEVLTLSYSDPDPSSNDISGVIQDAAGNDAASFSGRVVSNASTVVFNAPPTTAQAAVEIFEDTSRLLRSSDFPFTDPEAAALAAVEITTLPTAGRLDYRPGNNTSWTVVIQGQQISAADLDAGRLRYVPPAEQSGASLASFSFRVSDGNEWSVSTASFTLNVTALNDAPSATASGGTTLAPVGFSEGIGNEQGAAVRIFNSAGVSLGELDSGQLIRSLTFRVEGLQNGADETLLLTWPIDGSYRTSRSMELVDSVAAPLLFENGTLEGLDAGISYAVKPIGNGSTATLTLTFQPGLSTDQAKALITELWYQNTDVNRPINGDRVITLTGISDNGGVDNGGVDANEALTSASVVRVVSVRDAPELQAFAAANPTFTEGVDARQGDAVDLFTAFDIKTVEESQMIASFVFTAFGLRDGADETVEFKGGYSPISLVAGTGTIANNISYVITSGSDSGSVQVKLIFSGGISITTAESLLGKMAYCNTNKDNPSAGERSFSMVEISGIYGGARKGRQQDDGTTSLRDYSASLVQVEPQNDVPGLPPISAPAVVNEAVDASAQAVGLSGSIRVSDLDIGNNLQLELLSSTPDVLIDQNLNGTMVAYALPYSIAALTDSKALKLSNPIQTSNGGDVSFAYTYAPIAANLDFLRQGQSLTLTYKLRVFDGTVYSSPLKNLVISFLGTNDGPVITTSITALSHGLIEDGSSAGGRSVPGIDTASGTLAINDLDAGDTHTFSILGPSSIYGTMGINASTGLWTYTLANGRDVTQALREGDSVTETFIAQVTDGSQSSASEVITINIAGRNDAASISGGASGSVTEVGDGVAGTATASGQLSVSDVDADEALFQTPGGQTNGSYGVFTFSPLGSTGAWSYQLDNDRAATQALRGGESRSETLLVMSADGTASQVISVLVSGSNDAAAITGDAAGSVQEAGYGVAGTATASGQLSVSDVDADEAVFADPGPLMRTFGQFQFTTSTGAWRYELDNARTATQALRVGESVSETLLVRSLDGTASQVISVLVSGSNDAASISGGFSGSVQEAGYGVAGTATASGQLSVSDVDADEALFQTPGGQTNGSYGVFTFSPLGSTGAWSYQLQNGWAATQALRAGQSRSETMTVTSLDGTASQVISVLVSGSNDAPEVTAANPNKDVQWSDAIQPITFTVSDVDNDLNELSVEAWYQDPALGWTKKLPPTFACAPGQQAGTWVLTGTPSALTMGPGLHNFQLRATDPGSAAGSATVTLNVLPEEATVKYEGQNWVGASSTGSATVLLQARIAELADLSPAFLTGLATNELTNDKDLVVRFKDRETNALLASSIAKEAINGVVKIDFTVQGSQVIATAKLPVSLGSKDAVHYVVGTEVSGYVARNSPLDDTIVTVAKTGGGLVNGATGDMSLASYSTYGASGPTVQKTGKLDANFNVKLNKTNTNLQGSLTAQFSSWYDPLTGAWLGGENMYRLKATAWDSAGLTTGSKDLETGLITPDAVSLIAKATLTNVTIPLSPIAMAGNLRLYASFKDYDIGSGIESNSTPDQFNLRLLNSSGQAVFDTNGFMGVSSVLPVGSTSTVQQGQIVI